MIYIFTGDIRTGKTQSILALCGNRIDVGGFLSPDEDEGRVILRLRDRHIIPFEVEESAAAVIRVGRFNFLEAAFAESANWTMEDAKSEDIRFVVLDELGKLELKDEGYHDLILDLLKIDWSNKNLILVIRDFLLDELVSKYGLQSAALVLKHQLSKIFVE